MREMFDWSPALHDEGSDGILLWIIIVIARLPRYWAGTRHEFTYLLPPV